MSTDPSPDFTLDTPRPEDAEALARIHVRGWEVAYAHLIEGERWFGQEAVERRTAQWTGILSQQSPEHRLQIGRDADGTPIGFAWAGQSRDDEAPRPRELWALYIDEAWFGTGLGRALAEAILEEGPASVWVAEENPRARRFYEKLGFAADGATQVEEHLGGIRELRMVR
ncbi:GNAT family N-acetyltransferase [Brachybacterium sp. P6-10-X1]|uniref:GNAT family N-acetyltransferase n=1 Tax=Brachybacterium sp. P6-10-X1 TaxID=1903186 RepID=UPI000971BE9D|nr:GNAT family N-acetyltransferase [Brachybacterium sp. P6-10-X1]APX33353.1 GNAT family N-acetyltransferase [Brachybacterium sp. P6-10-X1]